MLCLVAQSCWTFSDPMDCSPPGSSVHGDSPDKNTGVGCHAPLQEIFPTQGSIQGLLHCRQILYQLSYTSIIMVAFKNLFVLFFFLFLDVDQFLKVFIACATILLPFHVLVLYFLFLATRYVGS